jgi:hypothetical protein
VQYGGHFTAIERSREEIRAIHRMSPVWRWHFEQCSNPIWSACRQRLEWTYLGQNNPI